jgi:hypothetical protein
VIDKHTARHVSGLGLLTAIVYILFSYGGIRSPDGEVVFLTGQALATRCSLGLTSKPIELHNFGQPSRPTEMQTFGLPAGTDGRYYSIFGPGQSVAIVPFIEIARVINKTRWYEGISGVIPISHFVGIGIIEFVNGKTPADIEPHALRFLVSIFNVIVGSLCVCFFFLLVRLLTRSDFAAWWTSILFAFGTLMMPYSGTFFSEPLATLFVILSTYALVWNDICVNASVNQKYFSLLSSGLFLGTAITVHISAILFTPFFFVYGISPFVRGHRSLQQVAVPGLIFSAGVGFLLVLLGYYNFVRFGNILETGRTAVQQLDYAVYVAPWRGLYGLVFGSGKGILWYSPAAVLSLFVWRRFHKRVPNLSYAILASVLFRIVYIASRSDWHGGFSLGPRYLVMCLPLLILPFGIAIAEWEQKQSVRALWLFLLVIIGSIGEQLYFSLGEIFSYLHIVKWVSMSRGIAVLANDNLYLDWALSPLLFLLDAKRGPFLMRSLHVSNGTLFWILSFAVTALLSFAFVLSLKKHLGRWH